MVREAAIYCHSAIYDIQKRQELDKKYPDHFKELIFEDFVDSPLQATENIYKFLGRTVPADVKSWLRHNTKHSSWIATRWQHEMGKEAQQGVKSHPMCVDLYLELGKRGIWKNA